MARKRRSTGDENGDLNLAPFMNMVVILIPLLLLSVVFVQVGVINITAPKIGNFKTPDTPQEEEEEPLNLTVAITPEGFRVVKKGVTEPAQEGCPETGPTICLADDKVDVKKKFDDARAELIKGTKQTDRAGEAILEEGLVAYNFPALYNRLVEIKKDYPDETVITLAADPDVPYAAVVRVMDVARYRLEKDSYSKASDFWTAGYVKKNNAYADLFSDPILSVAQ